MLGALQEIANPARSANVAVVEILAKGGKNIEPDSAFDRRTEHKVEQGASDQGIGRNLQWMLVKGSEDFDSARTVMNLVTDSPEKIGLVACPMPPVEDECPDEPTEQTFQHRILKCREVKEKFAVHPTIPGYTSQEHDSDLTSVEKSGAQIPGGSFRKFAAGRDALPSEEKNAHCNNQNPGKSHASLRAMKMCIKLREAYASAETGASRFVTEREASHAATAGLEGMNQSRIGLIQ